MTSPENTSIADIDVFVMGDDGPETVRLGDLILGKRVVIFTVPGAFTPTCHNDHMPGFVRNSDAIRAQGIDEILCVTVNDPFVVNAWEKATDAESAGIRVLADPGAELTRDHQLVVGSLLQYPAFVEDYDAVGHPGRGHAVRDENGRLALAQGTELAKDFQFGPGIQRRSRLVEDQKLRVAEIGARQRQLLPLPAR